MGFKDCRNGSGIQKPEGEMCCGIQKPHGWNLKPTYKRIQKLNHGKWDSKTTLCNGYCTFQDSKTRRRTCTAGFKNRISGILNPHMGGIQIPHARKWDSKTTLCNGYCTSRDSKTGRRTWWCSDFQTYIEYICIHLLELGHVEVLHVEQVLVLAWLWQ